MSAAPGRELLVVKAHETKEVLPWAMGQIGAAAVTVNFAWRLNRSFVWRLAVRLRLALLGLFFE